MTMNDGDLNLLNAVVDGPFMKLYAEFVVLQQDLSFAVMPASDGGPVSLADRPVKTWGRDRQIAAAVAAQPGKGQNEWRKLEVLPHLRSQGRLLRGED